jgi:hypothetical protein
VEDLGRRVERWVAAGVIQPEQGEAILALEAAPAETGGGRRAVVVEVLGYLGGGLALVAGFVLGGESWSRLGPARGDRVPPLSPRGCQRGAAREAAPRAGRSWDRRWPGQSRTAVRALTMPRP